MVHPHTKEEVAELSLEQIAEIIEDFAAAARRAKEAGFDAVQLHAAHGYLINQFLSPNTNQRTDDYGGSRENRARFCYQVYEAVRETVGPDYPVFIKLNSEDCIDNGLELGDAVEVAKQLSAVGIDAIEVSGGVAAAGKKSAVRLVRKENEEGYFLTNAQAVKAVVDRPVISVGGYRSLARVREALESVDAVALSRPFIRQPNLANLWKEGKTDKADCISCSRCFAETMENGLGCGTLKMKAEKSP
jgi:2,4-dienoyl-CoA reductase-like NADH-dependent reductase (Old Yellow Enzyme family)